MTEFSSDLPINYNGREVAEFLLQCDFAYESIDYLPK
jgi:hypothetical protein